MCKSSFGLSYSTLSHPSTYSGNFLYILLGFTTIYRLLELVQRRPAAISRMDSDEKGPRLSSRTTSSIEFLRDLERYSFEKPYMCNIPFPNVPEAKQHNISMHTQSNIPVYDVRGHERDFTLNSHGFELKDTLTVPSEPTDLLNDEWVQQSYYPMVKDFLLHELEAETVLVYDHVVRTSSVVEIGI